MNSMLEKNEPCPTCKGKGYHATIYDPEKRPCYSCKETGKVSTVNTLTWNKTNLTHWCGGAIEKTTVGYDVYYCVRCDDEVSRESMIDRLDLPINHHARCEDAPCCGYCD